MSYLDDFDVFIGGKAGILKGVQIGDKACIKKNIQRLSDIREDNDITALNWGNNEQREILIACGIQDRSIIIYDTKNSKFTSSFACNIGKGIINGIFRYNDDVITSMESGHITLWKEHEKEKVLINAGENLSRMCQSDIDKNIIATGGRESEVKLFNLDRQERIFLGKNVSHDWLELRVPIWISDLCFLPNTSRIVTVSKYGHVRLYDPLVQRRPITNLEIKDEALTAVAVSYNEMQVVVGSGKGRVNLIDLRYSGKILNKYKGFSGGITDLACSKTEPLMVSVSLDRHLRIHDLSTKKLLKQEYLTSRLNCLLLRSNFPQKVINEIVKEDTNKSNNIRNGNNADSSDIKSIKSSNDDRDSETEYDAMFNSMQVINNEKNEANLHRSKRKCRLKKILKPNNANASDSRKIKQQGVKKKLKESLK